MWVEILLVWKTNIPSGVFTARNCFLLLTGTTAFNLLPQHLQTESLKHWNPLQRKHDFPTVQVRWSTPALAGNIWRVPHISESCSCRPLLNPTKGRFWREQFSLRDRSYYRAHPYNTSAILTCTLHVYSVFQECITKYLSIKYQEMDVAHTAN